MEDKQKLSPEDKLKIDALLTSAKSFNYTAFVLSGLSFLVASVEKMEEFKLPLGGIPIPAIQTVVGLYFIVVLLSVASERLLNMAAPWIEWDNNSPPFAWIAFSSKRRSQRSVLFWIAMPIFLCAGATSISINLGQGYFGLFLAFVGVFIVSVPSILGNYWFLITQKGRRKGRPSNFFNLAANNLSFFAHNVVYHNMVFSCIGINSQMEFIQHKGLNLLHSYLCIIGNNPTRFWLSMVL